jgi:hypothetical protein
MFDPEHLSCRWSGYAASEDHVRSTVLRLYADEVRAPTVAALAIATGLTVKEVRHQVAQLERRVELTPSRRSGAAITISARDHGRALAAVRPETTVCGWLLVVTMARRRCRFVPGPRSSGRPLISKRGEPRRSARSKAVRAYRQANRSKRAARFSSRACGRSTRPFVLWAARTESRCAVASLCETHFDGAIDTIKPWVR